MVSARQCRPLASSVAVSLMQVSPPEFDSDGMVGANHHWDHINALALSAPFLPRDCELLQVDVREGSMLERTNDGADAARSRPRDHRRRSCLCVIQAEEQVLFRSWSPPSAHLSRILVHERRDVSSFHTNSSMTGLRSALT